MSSVLWLITVKNQKGKPLTTFFARLSLSVQAYTDRAAIASKRFFHGK
jgi:hypothetical protein